MSQTFVQETADKYGNPTEWKKQKLADVREYHKDLIKDLGISPLDFNMKMPFYDKQGRQVVGIFASEFKKEKGFFFELVTRDLDPLEPGRTVYRIARNDNFEEEYEMNERGSYLVPLEELRKVNPAAVAVAKDGVLTNDKIYSSAKTVDQVKQPVQTSPPKTTPGANSFSSKPQAASQVQTEQDCPQSEMTLRDYMAIHTGHPVSLKPWLNQLVTQYLQPPF